MHIYNMLYCLDIFFRQIWMPSLQSMTILRNLVEHIFQMGRKKKKIRKPIDQVCSPQKRLCWKIKLLCFIMYLLLYHIFQTTLAWIWCRWYYWILNELIHSFENGNTSFQILKSPRNHNIFISAEKLQTFSSRKMHSTLTVADILISQRPLETSSWVLRF